MLLPQELKFLKAVSSYRFLITNVHMLGTFLESICIWHESSSECCTFMSGAIMFISAVHWSVLMEHQKASFKAVPVSWTLCILSTFFQSYQKAPWAFFQRHTLQEMKNTNLMVDVISPSLSFLSVIEYITLHLACKEICFFNHIVQGWWILFCCVLNRLVKVLWKILMQVKLQYCG